MRVSVQNPKGNVFNIELEQRDRNELYSKVVEIAEIDQCEGLRLVLNGEDVEDLKLEEIENCVLSLELKLKGGKGGFGSLLRIAAAQKKKFNNFDSSRDMEGRRIRDIKNEKRLEEWYRGNILAQEAIDRENEMVRRLSKKKAVESKIEQTKHRVNDQYVERVNELERRARSSIKDGISKIKKAGVEKKKSKGDPVILPKKLERKFAKPRIVPKSALEKLMKKHSSSSLEKASNEEEKVESVSSETKSSDFDVIDLDRFENLEDFLALGADKLKSELMKLGLKCGGHPTARAQRLLDIKLDPSKLFNPKYLAKKKKVE